MATYDLSAFQFTLVYDFLSFTFATMMATTLFVWFQVVRKGNSIGLRLHQRVRYRVSSGSNENIPPRVI